jgi:hypothetical protein
MVTWGSPSFPWITATAFSVSRRGTRLRHGLQGFAIFALSQFAWELRISTVFHGMGGIFDGSIEQKGYFGGMLVQYIVYFHIYIYIYDIVYMIYNVKPMSCVFCFSMPWIGSPSAKALSNWMIFTMPNKVRCIMGFLLGSTCGHDPSWGFAAKSANQSHDG